MANNENVVTVKVVAETKEYEKSFKNVVKNTKDQRTRAAGFHKVNNKQVKEYLALQKQQSKLGGQSTKQAVQGQKQLQRELQKTTSLIQKQARTQQQQMQAQQGWLAKMGQMARRMFGGGRGGRGGAGGGPGGAPGAGGGGGGLSSMAGWAFGGGLGLAATLGSAAIGTIAGIGIGQISDGYQARIAYGRSYGGLIGMGRRRELEGRRGFGVRMGYSPIETAGHAAIAARQTGQIGAVGTAQALGRTTGMDVGEAGGFLGTLTRAGQGFGGRAGSGGRKELVQILAAGFESGLDRARMPEFMQSVGALVERQAGASAGDVGSSQVAAILRAFGASGMSGLQGARGGAVLSSLDETIRRPGGGEAGEALMLQALGFGKPGGTTSYYGARKQMQRGVVGEGGASNLAALFSETKAQYGGGEAQIRALEEMTGGKLTIDQLEAVRQVVEQGGDTNEMLKHIGDITKASKSVEEQALDEMKKGFGDVVTHSAQLENRLVGIGAMVEQPLKDIQKVINEVIASLLPTVADLLKIIADTIQDIWAWIKEKFPVNESAKERLAAEKAARSGNAAVAAKQLAKDRKALSASVEAGRDPGNLVIDALDDGMRTVTGFAEALMEDGASHDTLNRRVQERTRYGRNATRNRNRARTQRRIREAEENLRLQTMEKALPPSGIAPDNATRRQLAAAAAAAPPPPVRTTIGDISINNLAAQVGGSVNGIRQSPTATPDTNGGSHTR